jgi:large subunit ribosomal protein L5
MTTQFKEKYKEKIVPAILKESDYDNSMRVPRITKIVVNMGVSADMDGDTLNLLIDELAMITGQRPVRRNATKSVSNFKLREGMTIGAKVTMRGDRMYEFLERLINVALPRLRDFRGVSATSFDGRGNYTLGLSDQTIFPEINPDKVKKIQGMDITIVTTAETDEDGRNLLKLFGMPFATD